MTAMPIAGGHPLDAAEPTPAAIETRRLVDRRILLPAMVTLFLALIDRTNIGIAALQMNRALDIGTTGFGLMTGAFFIGSALSAIPSNIVAARVGAARWMAVLTAGWGLMTILMGAVTTLSQLAILRFLLGVFEGGFVPALLFWFGNWYDDRSRGRALALLGIPQNAAIIIGGPLGAALMGLHPTSGWRFLFLLEGIPALLMGLVWFRIPERPAAVRWLSPEQRDGLIAHLAAERAGLVDGALSFVGALKRPTLWLYAFLWFWVTGAAFGMMAFLPQILRADFHGGLTTFDISLLTALPPALGVLVAAAMTVTLYRTRDRRWHMALLAVTAAVALAASVAIDRPVAQVACYTIALGLIAPSSAAFWSAALAVLEPGAKAGGLAFISTVGTLGGAFAPSVIGALHSSTGSFDPGVLAAAAMFAIAAAVPLLVPRLFPKAGARPRRSV